MALIVGLVALAFGVPSTPGQARWGAFHVRAFVRSGATGWLGDGEVPTIVRRVAPGHGVSFEVLGRGTGRPVPDPVVSGCTSADGIDVRYLLERARGDVDISEAVVGTGWTSARSWDHWSVKVRLAFRVGSDVAPGTKVSCGVRVNDRRVRAVVVTR
jgi:hypothetical protein